MMADQEVPEEIQDYYQTERRERAGVAWLLAFGTLIATVVLAGGIFFGGRAVYRRFIDSDQTQDEVAQNEQPEEQPATESATDEQSPQPQPESSGTGGQGSAVQGEESSNNTDTSPNPTPTPTPTTGDAGDIPSTGPGSTLSIFFAVSILGYAIHRLYLKSN